jgi:hypothetical protein
MTGCGYINHVVPYQQCLPKAIEAGRTLAVSLPVGEDVSPAKALTLRVQTDNPVELACRLNGHTLSPKPSDGLSKEIGMNWLTAPVESRMVRTGLNVFEAESKRTGGKPTLLAGLELSVGY